MKEKRNRKSTLITVWTALGVAIILGFCVFSAIIGGNASIGYQENGQFFVCNHGDVVEVSETIWRISSVWEILFWIFLPLTPIGEIVILKLQKSQNEEKQVRIKKN